MTIAQRISTADMPREEWLAIRKSGIGGSDAPTALGLNPYKSNYALFEEKVGRREPDDVSDKPAVHWGTVLEPLVADEFARATGKAVQRVNAVLRHPDHPFMLGNIDRRVVGEKWGLEVKTAGIWAANSEQWGEAWTDEVPAQYVVQCQHYAAVTGYEGFYLAVLIGGSDFRIYRIPRNDELIAAMIEKEREFWNCVETRTAPKIVELADAKRAFPMSKEGELDCIGHPEIHEAVLDLRDATRTKRHAEKRIAAAQGIIGGFLGERDTLTYLGDRLLTWRTQTRKAFSVPESTARVMRLAGGKDE